MKKKIVKILIAEDEQGIGETYKLILEAGNHKVTLVHNGADCIMAFDKALYATGSNSSFDENGPFDIVILDARMPKKGGVDVAEHILDVCPSQKIIFATAYPIDTLDELREKVKVGIEVIQKPFDLDVFVEMVEDMGKSSRARVSASVKKTSEPDAQ